MRKIFLLSFYLFLCSLFTNAQTLEFIAGNGPTGKGPTTDTQTVTFSKNTNNPTGNNFVAPTPAISVSYGLSNQQFVTPAAPAGIVFGASTSNSNTGLIQEAIYTEMDSVGAPNDTMFTAAAPANSGGLNANGAPGTNPNYGLRILLNIDYLEGRPTNSKNYYGNLTLTFSRPVTNPVIQLSGMGSARSNLGHSAELKLITPGLSLTRLDGNQFLAVSGMDIVNTADSITGISTPSSSGLAGAATGSVQINGTNITSVTLELYVRGDGHGPQWQSPSGRAGDVFLLGVSLRDIITLSGNVFNDADGMTDNMIDNNNNAQSYPFTANGLFVNLFDTTGKFVAAAPVAANGTYSASVAPNTNYTVLISTTQGIRDTSTIANFPPSLPAGWGFTGEGITATGDGVPNGRINTVSVVGSDITNVIFGIDPFPESYNQTNNISGSPTVGTDYTLNNVPMQGSEGGAAGNTAVSWSGKNLVISSLPSDNFQLRYNGILIDAPAIGTEGYTINSYDPSLLNIRATATTPGGTNSTSFTYAVIDAAGLKDASPATYTVTFSVPLPVELLTFIATTSCPDIQVAWKTANEKNIALMELQVSGNGKTFHTIAQYKPKGDNSNYATSYRDENGKYLFRLKITEQSGAYNFSSLIAASLNCNAPTLEAYPVPLSGNILFVKYNGTAKAAVALYNAEGRIVKNGTLIPGRNEMELSECSKGTYWLMLLNSSENPIQIIKQ